MSSSIPESGAPVEPLPGKGQVIFRIAIVALLVALDLWSKSYVFDWLSNPDLELTRGAFGHRRFVIFEPWFAFMLSTNAGAAFGNFDSYPLLLVGGRVVAVLLIGWLALRATPLRPSYAAALVLILAGAMGNLHDNLFMESGLGRDFGEVRDFIDVYFPSGFPFVGDRGWHFPTFNVADSCITVGAILLLLSGLFGKKPEQQAPAVDPTSQD